MSDQLYQMNVAYSAPDDRLLLRITTRSGEEFRLWLTRRFSALLLRLLQKEMDRFGGAPSLAANPDTRRMFKQGAMSRSFEPDRATDYPLGKDGILACRTQAAVAGDGNLSLQILPETGQGVTLNLNQTLLYLFHNLLSQGAERAEWGLQTGDGQSRNVH